MPPGHALPAGHGGHSKDAPTKAPVPTGHGSHGPLVEPEGEKVPLPQLDGGVSPTRQEARAASGDEPAGHALQVDDATGA